MVTIHVAQFVCVCSSIYQFAIVNQREKIAYSLKLLYVKVEERRKSIRILLPDSVQFVG